MSSAHGNAASRVPDLPKNNVRLTGLYVCSLPHAVAAIEGLAS